MIPYDGATPQRQGHAARLYYGSACGNMRCEVLTHSAGRLCPMLATHNTGQRMATSTGMSRGGGCTHHNGQRTTRTTQTTEVHTKICTYSLHPAGSAVSANATCFRHRCCHRFRNGFATRNSGRVAVALVVAAMCWWRCDAYDDDGGCYRWGS